MRPSQRKEERGTRSRPTTLRDLFLELPRGQMHVVTTGHGPAVVALHGWPGCWYDYRRVLPAAGELGTCVAVDFFGFGHSEILTGSPVDTADEDAFARDILDLLDALEIEAALLVGHDIGSAVGPAVARRAPERVGVSFS
jgi:pimeloyl-ACP methyl ester carboxylesterase